MCLASGATAANQSYGHAVREQLADGPHGQIGALKAVLSHTTQNTVLSHRTSYYEPTHCPEGGKTRKR